MAIMPLRCCSGIDSGHWMNEDALLQDMVGCTWRQGEKVVNDVLGLDI